MKSSSRAANGTDRSATRRNAQYLPNLRRCGPFGVDHHPHPLGGNKEVGEGDLAQNTAPVRAGVHHTVPESVEAGVRVGVQHAHEAVLPRVDVLLHLHHQEVHERNHAVRGRLQDRVLGGAVLRGGACVQLQVHGDRDRVELLAVVGGGGHPPAALCAPEPGPGRLAHRPLHLCLGLVQSLLHPQLGLQILHRGALGHHQRRRRCAPDPRLLRLLLRLLQQGVQELLEASGVKVAGL